MSKFILPFPLDNGKPSLSNEKRASPRYIILLTSILVDFQVNNTDAEGRLTLADALVYTCKQGVDKVYMLINWVITNCFGNWVLF